tara:strand:+ start:80 stop:241 length:162 start_codon:yes stop_codon:yes gene_type:complete
MKLNDIKVLIAKGQKDPKKLTEEEVTTLKSFQEIVPEGQDVEDVKVVLKSVGK